MSTPLDEAHAAYVDAHAYFIHHPDDPAARLRLDEAAEKFNTAERADDTAS